MTTLTENKISVYPNPSIEQVNISFGLEKEAKGSLMIFDLGGKMVKSLYEGTFAPGIHQYIWDGSNNGHQRIAGTYICRLTSGNNSFTSRIIIAE